MTSNDTGDRRAGWSRRCGGTVAYVAGWTVLGVFFASQAIMYSAYRDRPVSWTRTLAPALADAYIWALLAPGIYWLALRVPIGRRALPVALGIHAAASVSLAVLKVTLWMLLARATDWLPVAPFTALLLGQFHGAVFAYWVILGPCLALQYYRQYRERELRAAQLEARLSQAQLEVLKIQLHPHFLFNTLHAIASLTAEDPAAATRMIAQLSELLRCSLRRIGTQEVALHEELEVVRLYAGIQLARFEDRLVVEYQVEPDTLTALVPSLLLQPLVENAIRHGIAPRREGGRVIVGARRDDRRLRLWVADDGPGLSTGQPVTGSGLGLENTRARLAHLYGRDQSLELRNRVAGGLEVSLTFPFRATAPDHVGGVVEP
jgi:two-component system LytT family sensor kinase